MGAKTSIYRNELMTKRLTPYESRYEGLSSALTIIVDRYMVYFILSSGVITSRLPPCTGRRSYIYGRFPWRGRTPAPKRLITSATGSALFICPQPETERRV